MIVYTPLLSVMTAAAFKAAKGLVRDFGEVGHLQVSKKGSNNFVTNADIKAEKTIRIELQKARPKFGFLLEEGGEIKGEDPTSRWVVDPLDGTNNFIHAVPYFCISIGLEKTYNTGRKEIIAGVVYDPLRDEMFTAEKHKGAFLNGRRIQVSARKDLSDALLGHGVPRKGKADFKPALAMLQAVTENEAGARTLGASALELAYVAAGRLDGYWHTSLHIWDIAAGILLVQEAGGTVADLTGGNNMLTSGQVLASNTHLHRRLETILQLK